MTADDDPPGKTRHKRTRTGCIKCRVRRRKCDEGKPRCQRCIDGGFECLYGPKLTFLDKNVMTVSRNPAPSGKGSPKYARLQFVGADAANGPSAAGTDARDYAQSPGSSVTLPTSLSEGPSQGQAFAGDARPSGGNALDDHFPPVADMQPWSPDTAPPPQLLQTPRLADHGTSPRPGTNPSPQDPAYETALTVLLSLGNDMPTPGFPTPSLRGPDPSPSSTGGLAIPVGGNLTQDRLLHLLRYYRYQVAPWLDICDMGQTFGLVVARMATESEGTLSALLALTARAQRADGHADVDDADYLDALAEGALLRRSGADILSDQHLAHVAFASARRFVTDMPASWQSPTAAFFGEEFLAGALEHAGTKTRASILTLFLRLDLSAALINGTSVSVPERVAYLDSPRSPGRSDVDDATYRYATEALLLCARAANFSASPFAAPRDPGSGGGATPAQRWTGLHDALAAWYAGRPHEFRPMAEMEGEESLFPAVLFTSGAAVLGNQMYHAAMLLLLQSRPRTLRAGPHSRKGSSGSSGSSSSQLWHARRVCGVSVNNDRRDGWDPCLVASLCVAARRLTYEPQQRAVLECLGRVGVITGWDLGAFAAGLRETWGASG